MTHYITDRGVQASAATAVVLGVLTVTNYSPPMLAAWAVWAGVSIWALSIARSQHGAK
ncbi:hypothetical protein C8K38_111183 [Rhodococcus sp. OK611]|nr:hypothetical protein C8K38_111183 [Rhodococcus sp. OK611]SNX91539.1 hypothetical protein SAMN05447004_11074 [Rhodococcus sp. OK270]